MENWLLAMAKAETPRVVASLAGAPRPPVEAFTDLDEFGWRLVVSRAEVLLDADDLPNAERISGDLAPVALGSLHLSTSMASEILGLAAEVATRGGDLPRAARLLLELSGLLEIRLGPSSGEQQGILRRLDVISSALNDVKLREEIAAIRARLGAGDRQTLGSGSSRYAQEDVAYATQAVDVFYATHRSRTGREDACRYFGGRRGILQFGVAEVIVTPNPDLQKLPAVHIWRLQFRRKWTDRAYLKTVAALGHEAFLERLKGALKDFGRREILLFVHGFNVSFRGAAEVAATLAVDLDLDGVPVLYSWPSQGNFVSYFVDRNNVIREHVDALADLFVALSAIPDVGSITVVAHSMGNQFLLSALERAQQKNAAATAQTIVFASPDVDRADFTARASELTARAARLTVYASRRDRALWLSAMLQAYDRAGDAAEPVIVPGVETIDTSQVSSGAIGHGDFAGPALDDLRSQAWFGLPAEARDAILEEATFGGGRYWRIVETEDADAFGMALVLCRRLGRTALPHIDQLIAAAPGRTTRLSTAGQKLRNYVERILADQSGDP
ncbi:MULTISPECIES: alpha/beta hydrolase [unclassified Sphingopyxis]|uniref:alpha/beta hydrolase n=1 Tax=unclassified Sphingopyxis TaxID=2614943 RepID=UPI000736FD0B|nr:MULTISPECIES: alpha/beta hydrolase [unclassified Sphingopyxis]KTE42931.1 hypothetical protein ATE62_04245 [Sphingopyxis sp. HIX]KTE85243.1 hypothetical protein ATE72_05120 [Sphingopyxis sp. HXXIV]